jgi:hypothetical protein
MIVSYQPPMVVNCWWRGVGARVVLELAIVVASSGPFGAPPEGLKAKRTRKWINIRQFIRHALTYTARLTTRMQRELVVFAIITRARVARSTILARYCNPHLQRTTNWASLG